MEHWQQHAKEAKIEQSIANVSVAEQYIRKHAKIEWQMEEEHGHSHLGYSVSLPIFEHAQFGSICLAKDQSPLSDPENAIVAAVVLRYEAALSSDALAAREMGSPMGANVAFYDKLLANPTVTVENVAFDLRLPVLENLPIERLIDLRKTEADSFARLRTALTSSIKEYVSKADQPDSNRIAVEVLRERIDPAVRKIEDDLKTAKRKMKTQISTSVIVGGAAVIAGLMTPAAHFLAPIGGTIGAGGVVKAVNDQREASEDVKMSDMYFLFAAKHAH